MDKPGKLNNYATMRDEVRTLMSSKSLSWDEKVMTIGGSRRKDFVGNALDQGNVHAAASLALGILEADAEPKWKAAMFPAGTLARLLKEVERVASTQDSQWAREILHTLRTLAEAPMQLRPLADSGAVSVVGPPESPLVKMCAKHDLTYYDVLPTGVVLCSAAQLIPGLKQSATAKESGKPLYAFHHSQLTTREKSRSWFF